MTTKKKYACVGTGGRNWMFTRSIVENYSDIAELVAVCDINQTRMNYLNERLKGQGHQPVPTYKSDEFDKMIEIEKPDVVIVTTMDRTHHQYIIRAMELGCDAITEKPMTVDEEKCQAIIDTVKETGKNLTVTFNYRYSPRNTKVKELIKSGEIGEVLSVHFEWFLDTRHGADYFRRWHRYKQNGGGLLVHKSTHHFDLVNWWLGTTPEQVFAYGRLGFYGRENAEKRGVTQFYNRATGNPLADNDPFALKLDNDNMKKMYLDAEHEDGYQRDQNVFGDGISIEDTMSVLVRYKNKTQLTYSLNAHCPKEGYRVIFNGTKGRIELNVDENSYVSGSKGDINLPENRDFEEIIESNVPDITLQYHWGKAMSVPYEKAKGGHGGGDVRLLDHVFKGVHDDPLGHAAGWEDGAKSILTGVAANKSLKTNHPVDIKDLVKF
jgi:predicted dehydrogenase